MYRKKRLHLIANQSPFAQFQSRLKYPQRNERIKSKNLIEIHVHLHVIYLYKIEQESSISFTKETMTLQNFYKCQQLIIQSVTVYATLDRQHNFL